MFYVDLNSDLGESFGNYTIGMDEEILPMRNADAVRSSSSVESLSIPVVCPVFECPANSPPAPHAGQAGIKIPRCKIASWLN